MMGRGQRRAVWIGRVCGLEIFFLLDGMEFTFINGLMNQLMESIPQRIAA